MDEQVKQKIQKILEYQKKDIELRKLNAFIEKDAALADMNKYKRAFNDAKRVIAECESQADSLMAQFEELKKYVEENEAALAAMEDPGDYDEKELEQRVKKLESLKSKFQNADKKVHEIDDKSRTVFKNRNDALKSGNTAKAGFGQAREKHGVLVNSKAKERAALEEALSAMPASLDRRLFDEYQKLVKDNKFPPIVPAVVTDEKKNMFNCGGCGLSLPQQGNASLKEQGWCRCDNCHRIIYNI